MTKERRSNPHQVNRRSLFGAPAVQALIIQGVAFVLVLLLLMAGLGELTGIQTVPVAALLQGVMAAAITRWRRLAPWWLLIQLLFPPALIALHSLHLPPTLFLAAFVFLLVLYWSTFRTQVPFYPSRPVTWQAVAELLPPDRAIRFVDIGSGLGGLILNLARRRPDSVFIGIEIAPLPWLVSLLRARIGRSSGHFICGDYERLDLADFDVVFAYLSPAAMPALWDKARAEMHPGALLLSFEFPIPDIKPDSITKSDPDTPSLYAWRL